MDAVTRGLVIVPAVGAYALGLWLVLRRRRARREAPTHDALWAVRQLSESSDEALPASASPGTPRDARDIWVPQ